VAVIQEQMLRAFISASQSCADALAKSATVVQRQSMERFAVANCKVAGLMGQALTQDGKHAAGEMKPARAAVSMPIGYVDTWYLENM